MHPLYGALPGLYVPAHVKHGALVSHRYFYAPTRCITSKMLIPLSVSLSNDLGDLILDGMELAGFKGVANAFSLI